MAAYLTFDVWPDIADEVEPPPATWPEAAALILKYTEIQNICFLARMSALRLIAL